MKKKTKRKMIIFIVILTFIFPIMVKVLDLNYEQMLLCVTFISLNCYAQRLRREDRESFHLHSGQIQRS